ncbi:MAG: thiamine-phosphate pyrophosphorylase [Candidatus Omnitrophota bacterium]
MLKAPANNINRIFDANINRAKEGLRVCEEITRFSLNSKPLTQGLKNCRHRINLILKNIPSSFKFFKYRQSSLDIGKNIYVNELKRENIQDIFFANIQRVKESIRVLEEFSKLKNINCAIQFKRLRYVIYEIEKRAAGKISALSHT